jgi:hypothetical protein
MAEVEETPGEVDFEFVLDMDGGTSVLFDMEPIPGIVEI